MYCNNCGAEVEDGMKFCSNCGQNLQGSTVEGKVEERQKANMQNGQIPSVKQEKYTGIWSVGRLVVGILSILLFCVITFQSCTVGLGNTLMGNQDSGGTQGLFTAVAYLVAGIVGIATRNSRSKGGPIASGIIYWIGAMCTIGGSDVYGDLMIWGILAAIFGMMFMFCAIQTGGNMKNRKKLAALLISFAITILLIVLTAMGSDFGGSDSSDSYGDIGESLGKANDISEYLNEHNFEEIEDSVYRSPDEQVKVVLDESGFATEAEITGESTGLFGIYVGDTFRIEDSDFKNLSSHGYELKAEDDTKIVGATNPADTAIYDSTVQLTLDNEIITSILYQAQKKGDSAEGGEETTAVQTEITNQIETASQAGGRVSVDAYSGSFPIAEIIDTAFSCYPDDMTEANMEITQNSDGSLHLSIQASSIHAPYVNNFSGDSIQITATEKDDLYILFASDGTDPDDPGSDVTVVWSTAEAIDFPVVDGVDELITYLYDGQYCYSGMIGDAAQGVSKSYQTMYVVNCNESITLRTSPSTQAAEICQIPLGAAVSFVAEAENGFYEISYLGNTGYALASYLAFDQTQFQGMYQTMRVVNCNESITLRTSPSTQAEEICQIPLGEVVSYIEPAENGFYKVIYLGNTGYALASYLAFE